DVVGSGTQIGEGASLDDHVFISNKSILGPGCQINSNVKIWPEKVVDAGAVVNSSLVWGDKWERELFTDSRVTGLANFELRPEFGAKLGTAFGTWLGKGNLVVMSRASTPAARMLDRSIICGLMSAGVHVHDLRVMPIPIVRYILRSGKDRGGIHVRRSPFDKKLLDILFFDSYGRDFSPTTTKAIERIFFREDFPLVSFDEVGDIDYPVRVSEAYVQDFLNHVDIEAIGAARLKVVIDYSYGAATQVFPTILGSLDCEVISLNAFLRPEKLTRTAGEFGRALRQLSKIVTSTGADIGFLIDAGAEKIFCVDENGQIIPSERLAILMTKLYFATNHPQKIAVPVSIPSQVEILAKEHKIEIVHTGDDDGSIIKSTEDSAVNYAVGTSGGFIFTDFHFAFDGMFSVVRILELMAKTGYRLGKLNDQIPKRALITATVPCPWEAKGQIMRQMAEYSEGKNRLLIDGVKIFTNGDWVLVIPDRERAFCHVVAEARNATKAKKLVETFTAKVLKWGTS
ncbi:MAG: nucleotidyltransferase, partial [bacterium]